MDLWPESQRRTEVEIRGKKEKNLAFYQHDLLPLNVTQTGLQFNRID